MTGVVDYGAGNLGSVMNALKRLELEARFVRGPEELNPGSSPFERVIFPGDGHFATAMAALNKTGYGEALKGWIKADKPFLGICIGLQLLFESSEEAPGCPGLGVIPGTVKKFPGRKVPQIGWNQTSIRGRSRLFRDIEEDPYFYYIHSYYADPAVGRPGGDVICAWTYYDVVYCAAAERGAMSAVQFHPEKSGKVGLNVLANWAGASGARVSWEAVYAG